MTTVMFSPEKSGAYRWIRAALSAAYVVSQIASGSPPPAAMKERE